MTTYLKAVSAAVVVGLGSLDVALGDSVLTWQEGVKVAIATLVAFGGVWAVPNATAGK